MQVDNGKKKMKNDGYLVFNCDVSGVHEIILCRTTCVNGKRVDIQSRN